MPKINNQAENFSAKNFETIDIFRLTKIYFKSKLVFIRQFSVAAKPQI